MFHDNKRLLSLLRDKKICFVGPAASLEGTNAGVDIDRFDYVIRTNSSVFADESHFPDYGSRTDILYLNNAFLKTNIDMKEKLDGRIKNLIKFLVKIKTKNVQALIVKGSKTKTLINSAIKAYAKVKNIKIDMIVEDSSRAWQRGNLKNLWKKNKTGFFEPTLSVFIISDLVNARPSLLYITGMDFYTGSKHWFGSYNETLNQKTEEIERRKKHHVLADLEYMQYLKNSCKFIRFDSLISQFLSQ